MILILPNYFITFPLVRSFYTIKFEGELGDSRNQEREWKGERRINVLLIGLDRKTEEFAFVDSLTVLVLDPEKKTLGIFGVNTEFEVFVPTLGKSTQLKKLYNLGQLEEERNSLDLIIGGTQSLLSINIDRYFSTDEDGFLEIMDSFGSIPVDVTSDIEETDIIKDNDIFALKEGSRNLKSEDFLSFLRSDSLGGELRLVHQNSGVEGIVDRLDNLDIILNLNSITDSLIANVRSDFQEAEFRRFAWSLRGLSFDDIKTGYTRLSSGSKKEEGGFLPIFERIDKDVSEIFFNIEVQREQARIEVLNGTATAGLGTSKGRWISNVGAKVINIGNSRDPFEITTVYVDDLERYRETISELENIFNGGLVVLEEKFPYRHTGDVVVVIGEDAVQ